MRVFVTGGTGFIGSHFIRQALAAGHGVLALRHRRESRPRIPLDPEPEWLERAMTEVTPGDLAGCEVLVHLAAHSANVPYDSLEGCLEQNVMQPLRLIRAAVAAGVTRYVVAGSCFEYGSAGERHEFIPPDAVLEPTCSYPASKAAATMVFRALACENRLRMLFLRIFPTYGEGELETRFWPSLRRAAAEGSDLPMTTGEQVRDFMPVEDVAACFVRALGRDDLEPGKPVIENLGSGHPCSLLEFARREWQRLGAKGRLRVGEMAQRRNEVMRFVPEVPCYCAELRAGKESD